MNSILPHLRRFALILLLATSASAQVTSPAAPQTPAKFQLFWKRVESPEHAHATRRLEQAEQRFKSGNTSKEELSEFADQVKMTERGTTYLLEIESKGGSLSDFVKATSRSEEISFNLINAGEPADLETELPPFTLKNTNWGTIIGVLEGFLSTRGLSLKFVGGNSPNPAEAKSVVCVLRRDRSFAAPNRPSPPEFASFQLIDHLSDAQSIDVIVDAIRSAWELDPTHDPKALILKFHPATKMLFASGPSSAAFVAREVIAGLRKNPVSR